MKTFEKVIIFLFFIFGSLFINGINIVNADDIEESNIPNVNVLYKTHVQDIGWQEWKENGNLAGTEGQGKRLEALQINTINISKEAKIKYQVHV